MFGLSFGEILIILVVALLVLGPTGMPKLARTLGKGLRDFRRTTGDLRGAFESEFYNLDQEVGKVAAATRDLEASIEGNHVPPTDPAAGIEGGGPDGALQHAPAAFSPAGASPTPDAAPAVPGSPATSEVARARAGTAAKLPDGAVAQAPAGTAARLPDGAVAQAPAGTAARLPDGAVAQAPPAGSAAVTADSETPADPAVAHSSADEPR